MATKSGFFGTAFKSLAMIGLGYAAKRLLSDPALRARVMDTLKSGLASVKDRAASLRGAVGIGNKDEQVASRFDSSSPSTSSPSTSTYKNGKDRSSTY